MTLGAFSAYAFALASLPVSTVATYAYVNPVIAVALGVLVVGERFTGPQLVGAVVVLLAVVLVVERRAALPKTSGGRGTIRGMTAVETIGPPAARRAVLAAQGFGAARPAGPVTRRHLRRAARAHCGCSSSIR